MTMIDIQDWVTSRRHLKVAGTSRVSTRFRWTRNRRSYPEIICRADDYPPPQPYNRNDVYESGAASRRFEVRAEDDYRRISTRLIRDVIGSGGSSLVADTGAKIDIEDDGTIFIAAVDRDAGLLAQKIIENICFEPEEGAIYEGVVTRIIPIGAFVEFAPGKEGMVHISKLADYRVEKVEDICKEGDTMRVISGVDEKGRMNLSRDTDRRREGRRGAESALGRPGSPPQSLCSEKPAARKRRLTADAGMGKRLSPRFLTLK